MKKIVSLALIAIVAASCSEEEQFVSPDNSPVEIKLSSGINEVLTKAPVNSGDSITARFVATTTSGDFTTNAWTSTVRFKALATVSDAFSFTPKQYYPINGSNIYIKGFYPDGTISGDSVTFSGAPGTNDVMITPQVSGTRAATAPLDFKFDHLLTQLKFKFVAGSGYDPTGKKVTSVVVKSQQIPSKLSLSSGVVVYTPGSATITGSYDITAAGAVAPDCPMVKAGVPVVLSITNSDNVTYPDITVADLTTEVKKSHLITLTFSHKEITATVSVTDWVSGGEGSAGAQ